LGIDITHIYVSGIREGSVIVDYQIIQENFEDFVQVIPQTSDFNGLGPILEFQSNVTPDLAAAHPCVANTEFNSDTNLCVPCTELFDSNTMTCHYCSPPRYYDPHSSTCKSKLSLDYQIVDSPLLWINIGFGLFTVVTIALIATKLKTYCLLENSNKSRKMRTKSKVFTLSLLDCHSISNIYFFTSTQATKLERMHYFLMKLIGYSLLSAVFIPTQINKVIDRTTSGWFDNIEAHIVFIPYYTIIIYTFGIYLAKAFLRSGEKPGDSGLERSPLETFVKTLTTLLILAGYILVLVLMIDNDKIKQDIWAANFVVCLIQEMVFLPWFTLVCQHILLSLLKNDFTFDNSFLTNFYLDLIDPNMKELMALTSKPSSKYYLKPGAGSPSNITETNEYGGKSAGQRSPDTLNPNNIDFSISPSSYGSPPSKKSKY